MSSFVLPMTIFMKFLVELYIGGHIALELFELIVSQSSLIVLLIHIALCYSFWLSLCMGCKQQVNVLL